jgi:hypothetical protein
MLTRTTYVQYSNFETDVEFTETFNLKSLQKVIACCQRNMEMTPKFLKHGVSTKVSQRDI